MSSGNMTSNFAGSNSERQSVGLPGHCDRCAEVGHVAAHPDLGCGDVGCNESHEDRTLPMLNDDALPWGDDLIGVLETRIAQREAERTRIDADLVDLRDQLERARELRRIERSWPPDMPADDD